MHYKLILYRMSYLKSVILCTLSILVLTYSASAQFAQDNDLKPDAADSWLEGHRKVQSGYEERIKSQLFKIDTLITRDSTVLRFVTKQNRTLKKIVTHNDSTGCIKHNQTFYFNSLGLPAYIRSTRPICPPPILKKSIYDYESARYERREYDDKRQLSYIVWNLPTLVTLRMDYYTDESGKRIGKVKKIPWSSFWR